MDIKEEPCVPDFCPENEREHFIQDSIKKIKVETSDSDTKTDLEDSTCTQHHVMRFNETTHESEIETKIEIKQEHCWLEVPLGVRDYFKDETHEEFCSTEPPSVYNDGASTYASDLLASEDLRNDISFFMNKDNPKYKSGRKYQSQNSVVTDTSPREISVCSETCDDGKLISMASSSKQSKVLQQNNKSKPDINKEICKSFLSHEYTKSYEHDVSEKYFKDPSYLEKHRLTLDSKEGNKCDVWDKELNHLSTLKIGRLIDFGKKPHKCNICNKTFTLSSYLKIHKLIHEGIKPHKCSICNTAFTDLSTLKKHKLFHEGIKPHKCNICNKAFTILSGLKRHKLIHEGIRPHKCMICNKAFTDSSGLKKHNMFHEGIKPHKCNVCNKAFTMLSDLKRHKLIHEGLKPH